MTLSRRQLLKRGAGAVAAGLLAEAPAPADSPPLTHRLPASDGHYQATRTYVEEVPVPEYLWASDAAYDAFRDIKFGVRIHWGLYSIGSHQHESWPILGMTSEQKQAYQEQYKTWHPQGFSADEWMALFVRSGLQMLSFTTKHHEGFSMYDTRTRVRQRMNWTAAGGPALETCDLAYSIMETPLGRDVVREVCDSAHRHKLKIDLYFSHTDWYDGDFRPYGYSPVQTPSAAKLALISDDTMKRRLGDREVILPDPTPDEAARMMARHRAQLTELLTHYGPIDMVCLDMALGPSVWPALRRTMIGLRKIAPDVLFRARGIGNYGDYYTPEGFVPGSKEDSDVPWMVIYPLGSSFSYDPTAAHYKGAAWIVQSLVDSVAKGGAFQVGIGPDADGRFHPAAIAQLHETGDWLKVNGEGLYATRARDGLLWSEGADIRYTQAKDGSTVYAFALNWPGAHLTLTTVRARPGSAIRMLGVDKPLAWRPGASGGTVVDLPAELQEESARPCRFAYGFKIESA